MAEQEDWRGRALSEDAARQALHIRNTGEIAWMSVVEVDMAAW